MLQNNWIDDGDNDLSKTKVRIDDDEKIRELRLKLIDRHEDVQVMEWKIFQI